MAPLLCLPVFVGPSSGKLNIVYAFGVNAGADELDVHLNILVCAAGAGALVLTAGVHRKVSLFCAFATVWLLCSYVAGMAIEARSENALYFAQTLIPVFAVVAGNLTVRTAADAGRLVRLLTTTTATVLCLLWVHVLLRFGFSGLLADRMRAIHDLAVLVPQYQNYYPFCVVISFNFALARYFYARRSLEPFLILAAHGLLLPICWSRTAVLGLAVSAAVQWALLAARKEGSSGRGAVLIGCAALGLPVLAGSIGVGIADRVESLGVTDVEDSDHRRLEFLLEGVERSWRRPLFGDRFVPSWDDARNGKDFEVQRLFLAHNQYVDLALRGGWLYLLAVGAIMVGAARRCWWVLWRGMRHRRGPVAACASAVLGILASLAVGSNFQLFLIQLQTATPCFFVIGLAYRLRTIQSTLDRRVACPLEERVLATADRQAIDGWA